MVLTLTYVFPCRMQLDATLAWLRRLDRVRLEVVWNAVDSRAPRSHHEPGYS